MYRLSKKVEPNSVSDPQYIENLVKKHMFSAYRKAFSQHNLLAFQRMDQRIQSGRYQRIILDSGCGTGLSSIKLAQKHEDCLVIGLDQSEARLIKAAQQKPDLENLIFERVNCEDIWRLAYDHNLKFFKHTILYPNPWPKKKHLKRRWYGHPVFPWLPKLAGITIVRSNWKCYLEEFNLAWQVLLGKKGSITQLTVEQPMTQFEKKYGQSDHELYELVLDSSQL